LIFRGAGLWVGTLEFVHFVLTVKRQLTTALARLRERGDRLAVGEGLMGIFKAGRQLLLFVSNKKQQMLRCAQHDRYPFFSSPPKPPTPTPSS
jgi:hypothetical protein